MLAGSAFEDGGVIERFERFTPVLVDIDLHADAPMRFQTAGVPAVVFCDAGGEKRHVVAGSMAPDDFAREMDRAIRAVFGE